MGYEPTEMPQPIITENFQRELAKNGFINEKDEKEFEEKIASLKHSIGMKEIVFLMR